MIAQPLERETTIPELIDYREKPAACLEPNTSTQFKLSSPTFLSKWTTTGNIKADAIHAARTLVGTDQWHVLTLDGSIAKLIPREDWPENFCVGINDESGALQSITYDLSIIPNAIAII